MSKKTADLHDEKYDEALEAFVNASSENALNPSIKAAMQFHLAKMRLEVIEGDKGLADPRRDRQDN